MENNKDKNYYLMIQGQRVEVSEEVYREYKRPDRAERKRKQRMWRCLIPRDKASKSFLKRCMKDCSNCPYGRQAKNSVVSLDTLRDSGYEEVDIKQDPESNYIAKEENQELYEALSKLSSREKELVRLTYYEDKTQEEIAAIFGVSHQAISKAIQSIKEKLKNILLF